MQKKIQSIAVIGLGRIGLPTALLASEQYETVFGVDHDNAHIETLKKGILPFSEVGLRDRLQKTELNFTSEIPTTDLYILAVPTLNEHGIFETRLIAEIVEKLTKLAPEAVLIIESTLPVGAMNNLSASFRKLAYCPERVAPGSVFNELATIPRCIAAMDPSTLRIAVDFYAVLGIETRETTAKIAELVKLSENAFRDTNIAFANQLSEICEKNESDVHTVIEIANTHPRVNILTPGLGAGGACLAPATRSLGGGPLFSAVRQTNEQQISRILRTLRRHKITSIALWGLAYKANCDDIRFSKAMDLKTLLETNGIEVVPWDPVAKIGDFGSSLKCEAIVFGVPHDVFRNDNLAQKTRKKSKIKYVVDNVHAIDIGVWNKAGFSCICA